MVENVGSNPTPPTKPYSNKYFFRAKKISLRVIERFVGEYMALSNNWLSSTAPQAVDPGSNPGNATIYVRESDWPRSWSAKPV